MRERECPVLNPTSVWDRFVQKMGASDSGGFAPHEEQDHRLEELSPRPSQCHVCLGRCCWSFLLSFPRFSSPASGGPRGNLYSELLHSRL